MKKERFFQLFLMVLLLILSISRSSFCQTLFLESLVVHPSDEVIMTRPEWKAYKVTVPNVANSVTIQARANESDASFEIGKKLYRSGEPSTPVPVEVGRNIIPFTLVSGDGKTRIDYTLTVYRSYPAPSWVRISGNATWKPRDSAGELVFGDRMWLIGGYTPEVINDIWVSSDGVSWENIGTVPSKSGVNIPVNLVYRDRMWLVGNDGALYSSPDGGKWDIVTSSAPWSGRYAMGGVVFKDRMWVMGGIYGKGIYNDVWSSTDGVEWKLETSEAPWSKRELFSMVSVFKGKMWIVGGGITIYHPFKAYTDVWRSSDGIKWENATEEAPWPARVWSTCAVYRNRLWLLGGFRAEPTWNNFNDVWYSADGKTWKQFIGDTIWSPRHELSAYVFDDKLWVVGGNSWPLMNDVWCLNIKGLSFVSQPVIEEFVGARYTYKASADFNESCAPVRYRLLEHPAWMTINTENGVVSGIPDKSGDCRVNIEAYDGAETATQTYILHCLPMK